MVDAWRELGDGLIMGFVNDIRVCYTIDVFYVSFIFSFVETKSFIVQVKEDAVLITEFIHDVIIAILFDED